MGKRFLRMKAWMMDNAYLVTLGCLMAIVVSCAVYTNGLHGKAQKGVQAAAGAPETLQSASPVVQPELTPLPTIAPLVVRTQALAQRGGEWPVKGRVLRASDAQEMVYWESLGLWQTHAGLDVAGETGECVKASMDGEVISAAWDELWGWRVCIAHGTDREMIYAGLESCVVSSGDQIRRGQTIGTLLERIPCEAELGPHVHLEMTHDGKYQDPEAALAER